MKKFTLIAAAALLTVAGTAQAAFTGYYDLSNWTQSTQGSSSIDTSGAPNSVSLTSDNSGGIGLNADLTIALQSSGPVKFHWSYVNGDVDGSFFDPFGYLVNGNFFQLTADGLFGGQSGDVSLNLLAGDIFGFRENSTDGSLGASTGTVSNFNVPEPGSLALLGLGLLGLAAARKRK